MRKRVYLSAPISRGCKNHNLYVANVAHEALTASNWSVFNPMLSMLNLGAQQNLNWEQWLANDLPWVAASDIVCRLPGPSVGAELECDYARSLGIAVVGPGFFPELMDTGLFAGAETYYRTQDLPAVAAFNRRLRREQGLPVGDGSMLGTIRQFIPDIVERLEQLKNAG